MAGISYFLGSHDFHYQNLIAHGEYPILVDLENIFRTDEVKFQEGGSACLNYSVLSSNLFPADVQAGRFCAVTGGNGENAQYEVPMLHMDDREIAVVYGKPRMEKGKNFPKKGVHTVKYLAEIEKGFDNAYYYLHHAAEEEIQAVLECASGMVSRHLVHGTQLYANILEASYHPSLMRKREGREMFIRRV